MSQPFSQLALRGTSPPWIVLSSLPAQVKLTYRRYWFGELDSDLRNLATCVWRSRPDAIAGGRGPAHKKAAMSSRSLYAYWKIDQHRLIIRNNAEDWEIVPWTDDA